MIFVEKKNEGTIDFFRKPLIAGIDVIVAIDFKTNFLEVNPMIENPFVTMEDIICLYKRTQPRTYEYICSKINAKELSLAELQSKKKILEERSKKIENLKNDMQKIMEGEEKMLERIKKELRE